ncbi:SRPBCC family protein [Nocardioides sp. SYSU D00038]|uniref:SRPBCC family protein n=1 Tax=Nocardioides sp. SYSU D00038 TaxID=2812554 RepID=UPI0027DB09C1|nr:SRPBCC family protein [Nocardioides sp. SYSU D00038]
MTDPTPDPPPEKLVFQIYVRATPEQVWEAITETSFRRQYFYGSTIESTFEVGSPVRSHSPEGELWGDDVVLECEPPHLLVHSWRSLWNPEAADEPPSRVTWRVEAHETGSTRLTVVHDQLEQSPLTAAGVSGGWMFIISGLKTVLETGAPLADPS